MARIIIEDFKSAKKIITALKDKGFTKDGTLNTDDGTRPIRVHSYERQGSDREDSINLKTNKQDKSVKVVSVTRKGKLGGMGWKSSDRSIKTYPDINDLSKNIGRLGNIKADINSHLKNLNWKDAGTSVRYHDFNHDAHGSIKIATGEHGSMFRGEPKDTWTHTNKDGIETKGKGFTTLKQHLGSLS